MNPKAPSTDRIIGCITGGAIGDAAGRPYEGRKRPVQIDDLLPWAISDDTQLTLATCEALTDAGRVDPETIARCFLFWFRSGWITGMGASTLKAMRDLDAGAHWAQAGRRGEYAAGNGAAMRIAPLALALDPEDYSFRRVVRDVCRITHHSDEAYTGALAVALAIHAAATSSWSPSQDLLSAVVDLLPDTAVRDRISELVPLSQTMSLMEAADRYGSSGYVVESVPLALLIVEKTAALGFEAVIRSSIQVSQDTDTIASMAGQIAGASFGYSGLPQDMLTRLPGRDEIEAIAVRFADKLKGGSRSTKGPR